MKTDPWLPTFCSRLLLSFPGECWKSPKDGSSRVPRNAGISLSSSASSLPSPPKTALQSNTDLRFLNGHILASFVFGPIFSVLILHLLESVGKGNS
jgi:hypothetical protein